MPNDSGSDSIHPLHDRFMKDLLHDPEDAADILRCALDPALARSLPWAELRQEPCEFIGENLGQNNSDLLYSLPFAEGRLWMFLLVEHLSRPDRDMPLRASEYKNCCHRHQLKKGEPPGPVLCVTLYHGKEPWKTPSNLAQWMKLGPGQEAQVASSMAAQEYLLLDISKLDVEALAMRAHAKMAVSLLRSIVFGREDEWLRSHIALIDEWLGQPDRQNRIRTLIRYCLQASSLDFSAFQREIDALPYPRVKDAFMSTADMLMEKGLEKGLEQGRSQGELIGKISAYERFLKVDPTNPEKLGVLSLDDLRERMRQLEAKLFQ